MFFVFFVVYWKSITPNNGHSLAARKGEKRALSDFCDMCTHTQGHVYATFIAHVRTIFSRMFF